MTAVDAPAALERAWDAYDRRLAAIGSDAWDLPTPCTEWTVRDLVHHVARCAVLYERLLAGERAADFLPALRTQELLGDDPLGATQTAWTAARTALGAPGALEGEVHHPAGTLPAAWLSVMAVEELVVHGWDLARATGGEATVDEELAAFLVPPLTGMLPRFGAAFRPVGAPDDEASPASLRLLRLTGRG